MKLSLIFLWNEFAGNENSVLTGIVSYCGLYGNAAFIPGCGSSQSEVVKSKIEYILLQGSVSFLVMILVS
jgi:hypothetical protein